MEPCTAYDHAAQEMEALVEKLSRVEALEGFPLVIACDEPAFIAADYTNFLWATFTRSNPSHDIYGVHAETRHKHWGCSGALVIDARFKPHNAPPLLEDPEVSLRVDDIMASIQK
jgi:4-hydroxy-3-polyprenylbenzoate decarboxylase